MFVGYPTAAASSDWYVWGSPWSQQCIHHQLWGSPPSHQCSRQQHHINVCGVPYSHSIARVICVGAAYGHSNFLSTASQQSADVGAAHKHNIPASGGRGAAYNLSSASIHERGAAHNHNIPAVSGCGAAHKHNSPAINGRGAAHD